MKTSQANKASQTPLGELDEAKLGTVLGYQLAQASITTDALFEEAAGQPLDLRPVEFTVLNLVQENPASTMGQLARALAVTAPHMTAIVDRLVERQLLVRRKSTEDRRAQTLTATAQGARLARQAIKQVLEAEAHLPLTAGERLILMELLHKVACARS